MRTATNTRNVETRPVFPHLADLRIQRDEKVRRWLRKALGVDIPSPEALFAARRLRLAT